MGGDVRLALAARGGIDAGQSIIADAVFDDPVARAAIADVAAAAGVPFQGLWLTAPPAILRQRVAARLDDASDSTVPVLEAQLACCLGAPPGWLEIDTQAGPDMTHQAAACALAGCGKSPGFPQ